MYGLRILIVEDEYIVAEELRRMLEATGAAVIGPVPSVPRAQAHLESETAIDGAVLDVNLAGENVFPLADALAERGVPFVFLTGYDRSTIPERFATTPVVEKPLDMRTLGSALARIVPAEPS